MAVLCAAAECRVTAKKEESTAVKLKAVSTNVGLPNYAPFAYWHKTGMSNETKHDTTDDR